ncbi:MAG TPA: DUF4340 domain-containing protein [Verrucomicrobiae bacterium]|nr:DUF4340 domain-containing protein [Verrucomicrobiae bacterium]
MNPKNTAFLVVLAAGLFAFIFFFERHQHKVEPGVPHVLPAFKPAEVTGVQILLPKSEISAERTNHTWQLTKPLIYPAQSNLIENLLQATAELTPQTQIPAQELKDRTKLNEEYGFDNPLATIVFQQGDEQRQLKLGHLTAPGDQIYAQVVGLDRVDIIDVEFVKKFVPRDANDWRDTLFINLSDSNFDQLTVANGAQGFVLQRESTNQPWHMFKPVRTRADYPKVDDLLQHLLQLRVARFVTDDEKADLESYGLQPPALEVKLDHGTNAVLGVDFGRSPTNDSGAIFVRQVGKSTVVLVPREAVAAWFSGAEEFRDRHLVRLDGRLPDLIEVTGYGTNQETFTVERTTNDSWHLTKPVEFPADTNMMRAFVEDFARLQVVRVDNRVAVNDAALPDPDFVRYGLVKPVRQYIIKRKAMSGSSNTVIAQLDFGSVKDGNIYVRRADLPEETSVYAVRESEFERLAATSQQLRVRRIWDFSEDDVTSIIIHQNGHEQKLIHKGPNHWSIAPGSQGMINELEVEVGAQELGLLEAANWIEASPANLARYGISDKSPQISVEVKLNGKLETLTLKIGWVPGGLRYGLVRMPDGQDWVFDFPPLVLAKFVSYLNLQDAPTP